MSPPPRSPKAPEDEGEAPHGPPSLQRLVGALGIGRRASSTDRRLGRRIVRGRHGGGRLPRPHHWHSPRAECRPRCDRPRPRPGVAHQCGTRRRRHRTRSQVRLDHAHPAPVSGTQCRCEDPATNPAGPRIPWRLMGSTARGAIRTPSRVAHVVRVPSARSGGSSHSGPDGRPQRPGLPGRRPRDPAPGNCGGPWLPRCTRRCTRPTPQKDRSGRAEVEPSRSRLCDLRGRTGRSGKRDAGLRCPLRLHRPGRRAHRRRDGTAASSTGAVRLIGAHVHLLRLRRGARRRHRVEPGRRRRPHNGWRRHPAHVEIPHLRPATRDSARDRGLVHPSDQPG